jgi:O-antigen ligase
MAKGQRFLLILIILFLPLQLGKHFWPDFSYVLGLRVDYLAPTIYLTDILIFWLFSLWGWQKKSGRVRLTLFPFSVLLFLLVNCFLAANQGAAFYKLVKILELFFFGFYLANHKDSLNLVPKFLPFPVIGSCLLALAQFIKQGSLNGLFWYLGERTFNASTPGIAQINLGGRLWLRPYATFSHPNALAGFIVISLILTLPFLLKKSKILMSSYLLIALSGLGLTFSRTAWLGLTLAVFLTLCSKFKFLLLLLLAIVMLKIPFLGEQSLTQRITLAKTAWGLIRVQPLIGVGLNNFIPQLSNFWQPKILWLQPVHNIYLLIAAETGLIGLLVFCWFIYVTFKRLNFKSGPLSISLMTILFTGFFDHYWLTLQQTQLLFTLVLGLSWFKKDARIN